MGKTIVCRFKVSVIPAIITMITGFKSILSQMEGMKKDYVFNYMEFKDQWLNLYFSFSMNEETHSNARTEVEELTFKMSLSEGLPLIKVKEQLKKWIGELQKQKNEYPLYDNLLVESESISLRLKQEKENAVSETKFRPEAPRTKNVADKQNGIMFCIDGSNMINRCYHATAYGKKEHEIMKNSKGTYINAIRVMVEKLLKMVKEYEPTHLIVCWDEKRTDTWRRKLYEDYKGHRGETPAPLLQQYETIKGLFEKWGIPQMTAKSMEADDIAGSIAKRWTEEFEGPCYIYSNDKDLLQLLSKNVVQIISKKGKGEVPYTIYDLKKEYGITPGQLPDVKSLLGDPSDNIPGCPGVGKKTALPLIQKFGSIEALYENIEQVEKPFARFKEKLLAGKEKVFLSKTLATIITDIEEIEKISFEQFQYQLNQEALKEELSLLEIA